MPRTQNSYKAQFDMTRKFGVEIEMVAPISRSTLASRISEAGVECYVENYGHSTPSYWKLTTDGSVNASSGQLRRHVAETMELVSPILKGEDGFRQLKIVCDVLAAVRADVNKTCGLHVHHDAVEFKVRSNNEKRGVFAARLYDAYAEYEGVIDHFMSASRRGNGNTYCHSHRGYEANYNVKATKVGFKGQANKIPMTLDEAKWAYTAKDRYSGRNELSRYNKVNLESLSRHGTVEFRQHNGTCDFEKIKNWIVFTQLFLNKAIHTTLHQRKRQRTIKELIDWLRIDRDTPFHGHADNVRDAHAKECADYLRNRYAHFAQLETWAVTTAW